MRRTRIATAIAAGLLAGLALAGCHPPQQVPAQYQTPTATWGSR